MSENPAAVVPTVMFLCEFVSCNYSLVEIDNHGLNLFNCSPSVFQALINVLSFLFALLSVNFAVYRCAHGVMIVAVYARVSTADQLVNVRGAGLSRSLCGWRSDQPRQIAGDDLQLCLRIRLYRGGVGPRAIRRYANLRRLEGTQLRAEGS
jgi:hypothetical protein